MDGVKLLVAVNGRTERATPEDIGGKVPVGEIGVVLVPAGLEFLDQACDCVNRFMRLGSFRPQCRTIRLMLVIHGVSSDFVSRPETSKWPNENRAKWEFAR